LKYSKIRTIIVTKISSIENWQIMKWIISKTGLTKALVVLITFGSLLGLSSVPASAAPDPAPEWDIEVNVDDTTPEECVASPTLPTWSPDLIPTYVGGNNVDKFSGPGLSVDFSVWLDFQAGTDMNMCPDSPASYQPTGDVEALFLTMDPQLTASYLDCVVACSASDLSLGTSTIGGTLLVADDAEGGPTVTYTARLKVVWTPVS